MSNDAPIVAYVIYGCPYCKAAVKLLRSLRLPHRTQNIGNNAELMIKLANQTGSPTVPKIFVNGQFIGGFTELEQLAKSGQLQQSLGDPGSSFGYLPLRGAKPLRGQRR